MNKITEFVDNFIPKNLSKKQKAKLKDELICHILDKKDYYEEIGYSESESLEKAIEDFGTDEKDIKYINQEFENLYSERNWFGVVAFFAVCLINLLCFPLDLWVMTADLNRYPEPLTVFGGFCIIFLILFIIAVLRIKMYRKSLIAVGVANILITASLLLCVYPQDVSYAIVYNLIYLLDVLTPISMTDIILNYAYLTLSQMLFWIIPIIIALYCFITAIRIKKGWAKTVKKPVIKAAVFAGVFFVIAVISSILYIPSEKHIDDYPKWFYRQSNYITETSENCFTEISIGDSYDEACDILHAKGYVSIEEYKQTLDRITLKQFNGELEAYAFYDEFEIWFMPDNTDYCNNFIGIKSNDGKITGIAIGDICKSVYVKKDTLIDKGLYFGYRKGGYGHNTPEAIRRFGLLKKGDSEKYALSQLNEDNGVIYGKIFYTENGKEKHIYRIYSYNTEFEDNYYIWGEVDVRYFELIFENEKLIAGTMYDEVNLEEGTSVATQSIK